MFRERVSNPADHILRTLTNSSHQFNVKNIDPCLRFQCDITCNVFPATAKFYQEFWTYFVHTKFGATTEDPYGNPFLFRLYNPLSVTDLRIDNFCDLHSHMPPEPTIDSHRTSGSNSWVMPFLEWLYANFFFNNSLTTWKGN